MINCIFSIPAATDPTEVVDVLYQSVDEDGNIVAGAGYFTAIPNGGIMPSSKKAGGRHLVHACVDATYEQVFEVTQAQRPVWQIFGCQDAFPSANPLFDPDIPETIEVDGETVANPAYEPPTRAHVYVELNQSVWNFLPDREIRNEQGDVIATEPQTDLHVFQGHARWESR